MHIYKSKKKMKIQKNFQRPDFKSTPDFMKNDFKSWGPENLHVEKNVSLQNADIYLKKPTKEQLEISICDKWKLMVIET